MPVDHYELLEDNSFGRGNFLELRRLKLRAVLEGGERTREGVYDFVERPRGLDAVVLAIWSRAEDGRARVLLREAVRIPLVFGRSERGRPFPFVEVVAGILEAGEEGEDAIRARAAAEAHEEAGLRVAPERIERLGPAMFPTPGMCAELFHLLACEVSPAEAAAAVHPPGDGSPFEEGAAVRWALLDEALAACGRGEIRDLKTELVLRRLRERVGGA